MAAETWLALAAGALLALVAGLQLLALARRREEPNRLLLGLRIGVVLLAAAALLLAAGTQGAWLPTERGQLALSLLLATQIARLGLVARSGRDGSGPVADLASLGLLVLVVVFRPTGAPPACAPRSAAFYAQWILLVEGAGAAIVAGSIALRLSPSPFQGEGRCEGRIRQLLQTATGLAALLLVAGLVVGAAWAWRTTGALVGPEPPGGWMAVGGLLAAMSLLAWQLEKRPVGWAAILAVLSAVSVLLGLLL
jgi:hypothetical protein